MNKQLDVFKHVKVKQIVEDMENKQPTTYNNMSLMARGIVNYASADDLRAFKKAYMKRHKELTAHLNDQIKKASKK